MTAHRITFYTRRSCHLCDSAYHVLLTTLAGRHDVAIDVVDVDSDCALAAAYGMHVPVIHLDGIEIARHRLDGTSLRAALSGGC